jgi:hypothetical protein
MKIVSLLTISYYIKLQIYKSVKSSHTLEVYESAAIQRLKMNKKDFNSLSNEDIMNIKIRCLDNPSQWVLRSGVEGVEGPRVSGVASGTSTGATTPRY